MDFQSIQVLYRENIDSFCLSKKGRRDWDIMDVANFLSYSGTFCLGFWWSELKLVYKS